MTDITGFPIPSTKLSELNAAAVTPSSLLLFTDETPASKKSTVRDFASRSLSFVEGQDIVGTDATIEVTANGKFYNRLALTGSGQTIHIIRDSNDETGSIGFHNAGSVAVTIRYETSATPAYATTTLQPGKSLILLHDGTRHTPLSFTDSSAARLVSNPRVAFVRSDGSDTSGVLGRQDLPFLTGTAGLTAGALSFDFGVGTFTILNLPPSESYFFRGQGRDSTTLNLTWEGEVGTDGTNGAGGDPAEDGAAGSDGDSIDLTCELNSDHSLRIVLTATAGNGGEGGRGGEGEDLGMGQGPGGDGGPAGNGGNLVGDIIFRHCFVDTATFTAGLQGTPGAGGSGGVNGDPGVGGSDGGVSISGEAYFCEFTSDPGMLAVLKSTLVASTFTGN